MASLDSSPAIVGKRPAAFDLLDMLRAIEQQQPLKGCRQRIAGYRLGANDTERLQCKMPGHRIERPWRHVHRAETDTRAAWNRITRLAATRA